MEPFKKKTSPYYYVRIYTPQEKLGYYEKSTKTKLKREAEAIQKKWQDEAIKEKALSQFTVEEQLKSYVLDMAMAHVTKALPNLQVKNVNDLWKLHKIVTTSLA